MKVDWVANDAVFLLFSLNTKSVSFNWIVSDSTWNSAIPKQITEQPISRGFLIKSERLMGKSETRTISLRWTSHPDGRVGSDLVRPLTSLAGSCLTGVATSLVPSSSSSLKQITAKKSMLSSLTKHRDSTFRRSFVLFSHATICDHQLRIQTLRTDMFSRFSFVRCITFRLL